MTTRRLVGWAGELLLTLGVLLLLFAAWQLWWTDVVADREQGRIVRALETQFARGAAPPGGGDGIPDAAAGTGAFAVVRIPRFGADYARPVIEGTGRDVLALGVGPLRRIRRPRPSATSPSPGTARRTAGRSTTSTGS